MNPTALAVGMATVGIAVLGYVAWLWHGLRQSAPSTRTPDDVAREVAAYRARRIADTQARLHRVPAAADNAEGTRLDWHDECERLWSAPYDPQTGLELLRREINKQQREEG